MKLLELFNTHLGTLAAIVTSLLVLIPQVRRVLGRLWTRVLHAAGGKKQDLILEKLELLTVISATLVTNSERLAVIEKEMKFNGGQSIKDMLYLMFAYRRHDFWRIGRPAMEMDGNAQATLVSEVACRLFGVANPDDLKRRSWLRFIDKAAVDPLLSAFKQTVDFHSEFVWQFHIHTGEGQPRGLWEFRASPITQELAETKIYSGHLIPVDDAALAVAREIHAVIP